MPAIESTKVLKNILHDYFHSFFPANGPAPKVAWCTSVGPAELLISLGFKVYFPENHGALLGATRTSERFIPKGTNEGYSQDICSYLTSDIGSFKAGETPLTKGYGIPGVPKPDVLVYNTNQCREVQDWFRYYSDQFNVPALGIISPWKVDELVDEQISYVEKQLLSLVPKLEEISGNRFDPDKLRESVALSKETSDLWSQFLASAKSKPSPITFFDACIQMAPAVVLRGRLEAVAYYKILNKEIASRALESQGAITNEQTRIYWEGMPVWGRLRFFSDLFERLNTCVVASTYCDSWIFEDFNCDQPFNSMAKAYTKIFINRSENQKEATLNQLAADYEVDGILYHDAKTCPYNSNSRFGMPQRITSQSGVPHLIIDGDVNDLRCMSDEQVLTCVEAFIDQISDSSTNLKEL